MQLFFQRWSRLALLGLSLSFSFSTCAAEILNWNTNQNRVSAQLQSVQLLPLLEGIAKSTGWQVYLESNTTLNVSTKFQNLPPGDALRMLLGNLNFALVPENNSRSRLYVFRTSQANATQLIRPAELSSAASRSHKLANELIITLKPGVKIDGIACLGTAKITGRVEALNTYRLAFKDEAAAQSARECFQKNPDVASIDSNFSIDPPPSQKLVANPAADLELKPKANDGDCQVIIGLIDTAVASLGKNMDAFMMPALSVGGDAAPSKDLTHGTAMAETILQGVQANSAGNNSSVKILPVDVYGANASTSTFEVAQGIYKAVNAGANVINLSLGSDGDSAFLHTLIQNASKQGVVFFGAAGNQPVTTPVYPAAYSEVNAVTAGSRPGQIADYANRGSFVDLMTPGTSVVPYQGQSYAVSGTSTATAFASGIAAALADAASACPDTVLPTLRAKFGVNLSNTR
ncbi:MAG: thermitase [Verrucomicrobiota bacterium]